MQLKTTFSEYPLKGLNLIRFNDLELFFLISHRRGLSDMNEADYLFVYGTLLHTSNYFGALLNHHACLYSEGHIKGRLYHAGEYPALITDPESESWVYGKIFRLQQQNKIWKELDEYEGFGPGFSQPNEFVRVKRTVCTGKECLECWLYQYNLSSENLPLIESGRYGQY
ncbi:gamma-glutamylcyclotransferase family protein [Pararcticibacter amylolyticus]|uniref:Gamma-glutamylcyclotransferase n=1 Tax=Pararcticibacter amylolyticus TaxID=2173175 RepID=A0A2U2PGK6_9SPHI|nr:gamma-glutamylcyclotransferase family protein [Pararcticibacter amylolyticus]PWG80382.1 gamma-glutamylcyclotransferase [Pararcticibacter amylolyticus]